MSQLCYVHAAAPQVRGAGPRAVHSNVRTETRTRETRNSFEAVNCTGCVLTLYLIDKTHQYNRRLLCTSLSIVLQCGFTSQKSKPHESVKTQRNGGVTHRHVRVTPNNCKKSQKLHPYRSLALLAEEVLRLLLQVDQ